MHGLLKTVVSVVLAVGLVAAVHADQVDEPLPSDPTQDPMLLAAGFLQQHPDLIYRKYGMDAVRQGKHAKALEYFRRAGYYADKPSQAMVAELLWTGQGVPRDRAAAYAWMDLAAEREYRVFALQREKYWLELSDAERARALEVGQELYARYRDEQAKPRLEQALRWESKKATGSRLGGFAGASVKLGVPDEDGNLDATVDGSKFYDPRYWDPDKYWAYTDKLWHNVGKRGQVTVGELRKVSESQLSELEASGAKPQVQPSAKAEDQP